MRVSRKQEIALEETKNCTLEKAIEMGLSKDEFELICKKLKRTPNFVETGIFSANVLRTLLI